MVIGLTGGMGCGKSTVAAMFERRGFGRVDCDAIAHDLLANDEEVKRLVVGALGSEVVGPDGRLERASIGLKVFGSEPGLRELESILHPRIRDRWDSLLAAEPGQDWVVEIPLLFEKNLQNRVDFTVCVFSELTSQVERLERIGMDRAQALARIDRQMPVSEKADKADYVLLNEGSLEFLEDQVNRLLTQF
ncbi:MAG: dephospho-CoA kinase [Opitutales bacterium TMED158]|nr:MAG: dephospho-CoA kinase [Opitutales bacterium TMED158]